MKKIKNRAPEKQNRTVVYKDDFFFASAEPKKVLSEWKVLCPKVQKNKRVALREKTP